MNLLSRTFVSKIVGSLPDEVREADKIAVAFSGGADSLALLTAIGEIFKGTNTRILALHCNFHLRGKESDEDTVFCRTAAASSGAGIEVRHFPETGKIADETDESMEMVCRRLRYDWFAEYAKQGYYIGIAHNREDNRETLMLNLLRGTGVRGLKGMESFDPDRRIFRPMLEISRVEIERYLISNGLKWRTDSSNLTADVLRNKLRLNILPEIGKAFPVGLHGLDISIRNFRSDFLLIDEYLRKIEKEVVSVDGRRIDLIKLRTVTSEPARVLLHILSPSGFNFSQCRAIAAIQEGTGYKTFISEKAEVYANGNEALIEGDAAAQNEETATAATLEELCRKVDRLTMEIVARKDFDFDLLIKKDPYTVYFDYDRLAKDVPGHFYEWRRNRTGDRMKPYGMRGKSKLISDIMTDMHASPMEKASSRVLTSPSGDILWLAPVRATDHCKIMKDTRRIAILRFEPKKIAAPLFGSGRMVPRMK